MSAVLPSTLRQRKLPRVVHRWTPYQIRLLRYHLALCQRGFAAMLGVRYATVCAWETGHTRPRRSMQLLLGLVAQQYGFPVEDC